MSNYVSKNIKEQSDTLKKLTPQTIYQSLVDDQRGTMWAGLLWVALVFLVVGVVSVIIFLFNESISYVNYLLMLIPLICAVGVFMRYTVGIKAVKNGEYSVFIDVAERVVEADKVKKGYQRGKGVFTYYEHAVYLSRCGRQTVTHNDTCVYAEGDEFYVVTYNKTPNKAVCYYSTKYYILEQ